MQENLKLEEYCSRLFFGQELAAASGTITCDVTYKVFKKKKSEEDFIETYSVILLSSTDFVGCFCGVFSF